MIKSYKTLVKISKELVKNPVYFGREVRQPNLKSSIDN